MNPEVKKIWVDALRSGNYKQGSHMLHTRDNKYCCLGVLCAEAVKHMPKTMNIELVGYGYMYDGSKFDLPQSVMDWAELTEPSPLESENPDDGMSLASRNDTGEDFDTIADVIEEKL